MLVTVIFQLNPNFSLLVRYGSIFAVVDMVGLVVVVG